MSLVEFARRELQIAGLYDKDGDYGGMMGDAVMKMVEQFAEEGHSGFSAAQAIGIFERIARFEPLTPLTGADDEWVKIDSGIYQNRRCPHVFRDASGAYDGTAVVFEDPDGCRYTNLDSRRYITFPYTPSTRVEKRSA